MINNLSGREYAAIHLRVPDSGTEWIDDMIRASRQLDHHQSLPDDIQVAGERNLSEWGCMGMKPHKLYTLPMGQPVPQETKHPPETKHSPNYPWREAPAWAKYAAMEPGGQSYWYQEEPFLELVDLSITGTPRWSARGTRVKKIAIHNHLFDGDWKYSLEARPVT